MTTRAQQLAIGQQPQQRRGRRASPNVDKYRQLKIVYLVGFIHQFAIGCVLTATPSLILDLYDGDSSGAAWFAAWTLAGSAAIQFFSNAIYGNISDLIGRKWFVVYSVFGGFLWLGVIAIGQSLTSMLIAGVIRGITDAVTTISLAILGDLSLEWELGNHYGKLGGAQGIGVIIGPLIGAAVGSIPLESHRWPFILATFCEVIGFLISAISLSETLGYTHTGNTSLRAISVAAHGTTARQREALTLKNGVDDATTSVNGHTNGFASSSSPAARLPVVTRLAVASGTTTPFDITQPSSPHNVGLTIDATNGHHHYHHHSSGNGNGAMSPTINGYMLKEDVNPPPTINVNASSTPLASPPLSPEPQSPNVPPAPVVHVQSANPFKALIILNSNRFCLCLSLAWLFFDLAASGMVSVFFLYAEDRFNWGDLDSAGFLFCFGLVAVIGQIVVLPRTLPEKKWGERKTVFVGVVWMGSAYFVIGFAWVGWFLYVVCLFAAPAFVFSPALRSAIANEIPASQQGQLQGGLTCLGSLGTIFGPLLVSGSFSLLFDTIPGAPWFLCAILMGIAAIFVQIAYRCYLHTRLFQPEFILGLASPRDSTRQQQMPMLPINHDASNMNGSAGSSPRVSEKKDVAHHRHTASMPGVPDTTNGDTTGAAPAAPPMVRHSHHHLTQMAPDAPSSSPRQPTATQQQQPIVTPRKSEMIAQPAPAAATSTSDTPVVTAANAPELASSAGSDSPVAADMLSSTPTPMTPDGEPLLPVVHTHMNGMSVIVA